MSISSPSSLALITHIPLPFSYSLLLLGEDNEKRLTGKHETQSIDKFSYGVSDRGASIRIPIATVENGWKGWLEDRRPNSSADPYKVAARIIATVKMVPEEYVYVSNGNGKAKSSR